MFTHNYLDTAKNDFSNEIKNLKEDLSAMILKFTPKDIEAGKHSVSTRKCTHLMDKLENCLNDISRMENAYNDVIEDVSPTLEGAYRFAMLPSPTESMKVMKMTQYIAKIQADVPDKLQEASNAIRQQLRQLQLEQQKTKEHFVPANDIAKIQTNVQDALTQCIDNLEDIRLNTMLARPISSDIARQNIKWNTFQKENEQNKDLPITYYAVPIGTAYKILETGEITEDVNKATPKSISKHLSDIESNTPYVPRGVIFAMDNKEDNLIGVITDAENVESIKEKFPEYEKLVCEPHEFCEDVIQQMKIENKKAHPTPTRMLDKYDKSKLERYIRDYMPIKQENDLYFTISYEKRNQMIGLEGGIKDILETCPENARKQVIEEVAEKLKLSKWNTLFLTDKFASQQDLSENKTRGISLTD